MEIQSTNQKQFIPLSNERKFNPLTRQSPVPSGTGDGEGKMGSVRIEDAKLKKACQDFESIFLFHLLKSMRSSVPKDGLLEKGLGNDIFTSMMDEELAKRIAHTQGVGISDVLYQRLSKSNSKEAVPQAEEVAHLSRILPNGRIRASSDFPNMERVSRFDNYINLAAKRYEVSPELIRSVIYHESGGNPKAVSHRGAKGLMQLVDSTAQEMGVRDVFNPKENILAGTKYLKSLIQRFNGDLKLALAAYNAGPTIVEKLGGVPPFRETVNYVNKVLGFFQKEVDSK
jgi:Rod binding domain-containing protein